MLLFEKQPEDLELGALAPSARVPREYQLEDIAAAESAWEAGAKRVLYRGATGLGKAVVLGTIAATHRPDQRTLCLIDTIKLAQQLRKTFARQLGFMPGLVGGGIFEGMDSRVVVAVQQSLQRKGRDGRNRAERAFNPMDYGTLLIDETESAMADGYMSVARHWINGNPDLHVFGCSATPIRGDGVGMGALFDHVVEDEGPLNRGPLWGFTNGWLVPPRQAFIRVSADFGTLKIRKGSDGDKDYNEDQLTQLIASEQHLIEIAKGIVETAGHDRCIVVCPNSTDVCDALAGYLNGAKPGSAMSAHGKVPNVDDVMEAHQRGEFQFLVAVNLVTKGYDDPRVSKLYILRPTKSQRLFQQIIGRGFRPHDTIAAVLGELATAAERRAMIAQSVKPVATIYCLVGIGRAARDMQIADLLNGQLTDEELQLVKQKMLDGPKSSGPDEPPQSVADVIKQVKQEIRDQHKLVQRSRVGVENAEVHITEMNDQETYGTVKNSHEIESQLLELGFKDYEIRKLSPAQAKSELHRWRGRKFAKPRLCGKGQWRILQKEKRLSDEILKAMTFKEAHRLCDEIFELRGWNR